jgi:asparagine synthase (glutamine-hydrolysing)
MGAIVAVVQKRKQTAANTAFTMLKELSHRGKDAYAIASAKTRTLANSIGELNPENIQSNIALGYAFSKMLPKDIPQLFSMNNFALVLEGRISPSSKTTATKQFLEKLKSIPEEIAKTTIKDCNGAYTFAIATMDSLIVGRDVMGLAPLYYGKNQTICAFASERKALWKLGLKTVAPFPPGNIARVKKDVGLSFKPVKLIKQSLLKPLEIDSAAKHLQRLLLQSMEDCVSGIGEVAVAFSGGLDSSIVAFLTQKCGIEAQLITVGLENTPETEYAEEAAKALNLPIHVKTYTIDDVEKVLPKVLWLIEEPSALNASIAIPLYWTAELAAYHGLNVLMAGQGADELFGGYHKYLSIYAEKGADALQRTLFDDVRRCYETNFQRDNKVCAFHNVELGLPFVDLRVVNFGLSLPLSLKIESPTDKLRKRVLRKVAENFAMPTFIVNRAKKAVQYATGVDKALCKLAKREDLNPSAYVRKVFQRMFPDVTLDDQDCGSLHA